MFLKGGGRKEKNDLGRAQKLGSVGGGQPNIFFKSLGNPCHVLEKCLPTLDSCIDQGCS